MANQTLFPLHKEKRKKAVWPRGTVSATLSARFPCRAYTNQCENSTIGDIYILVAYAQEFLLMLDVNVCRVNFPVIMAEWSC